MTVFSAARAMLLGAAFGVAALPALAEPVPAAGETDKKAFVTMQVENDLFANLSNTDRHYTNGLRLAWLSAPRDDLPKWLTDFSAPPLYSLLFPTPLSGKPVHRIGVAFGHAIFTPDDTASAVYLPNERPYAAWAHLTFSLQSYRRGEKGEAWQDNWKLDVGVVGPAAQGEWVQNDWHDLIGAEQANGWHNQIRDEIGVNLSFERAWRSSTLAPGPLLGWQTDVIPYTVVSLGTVQTYAGIGGTFRVGPALPDEFGPTRIYPGTGGSEWFETDGTSGCNCYLFAGAEGRAVARDIFLDGNTFRDSVSIDKEHFVYDLKAGFTIVQGRARLSFTHVFRSKEYKGQPKPDQFGSIALTIAY